MDEPYLIGGYLLWATARILETGINAAIEKYR